MRLTIKMLIKIIKLNDKIKNATTPLSPPSLLPTPPPPPPQHSPRRLEEKTSFPRILVLLAPIFSVEAPLLPVLKSHKKNIDNTTNYLCSYWTRGCTEPQS